MLHFQFRGIFPEEGSWGGGEDRSWKVVLFLRSVPFIESGFRADPHREVCERTGADIALQE